MTEKTIGKIILKYLEINFPDKTGECFGESFYGCERYIIDPEHLAKYIKEYNPKNSKEITSKTTEAENDA